MSLIVCHVRALAAASLAMGLVACASPDRTGSRVQPSTVPDGGAAAGEGGSGDGDGGGGGGRAGGPPQMPPGQVEDIFADPWNGVSAQVDPGVLLPIVFVHDAGGSAEQYEPQALRWAANGYPRDAIVGFEYDGSDKDLEATADALDAFIEQQLSGAGADHVYVIAHGLGTSVVATYLRRDGAHMNVAKYIAIEGSPCPITVSCLSLTKRRIPGDGALAVLTSAESFAMQYAFLLEQEPMTTEVP